MTTVAVVGLGYVGLPLAVGVRKEVPNDRLRPSEEKVAPTANTSTPRAKSAARIQGRRQAEVTTNPRALREADFIIVAVPTPVDEAHNPDFEPLIGASTSVGQNLTRGRPVVFESTVYPGATEEVCVPVIEKHSGPEVEAGLLRRLFARAHQSRRQGAHAYEDRQGGRGRHAADAGALAEVYGSVVSAGVHRALDQGRRSRQGDREHPARPQHRADERARDHLPPDRHRHRTKCWRRRGTKWNFLPFRPGLVGGHCIGVDPYYLTYKAETLGYHPQVILSRAQDQRRHGEVRRRADREAHDPARISPSKRKHHRDGPHLQGERARHAQLPRVDGGVSPGKVLKRLFEEAEHEYGIRLVDWEALPQAAAVVAAVAHDEFKNRPTDAILAKLAPNGVYVDVKNQADDRSLRARGHRRMASLRQRIADEEAHRTLPAHELDRKRGKAQGSDPGSRIAAAYDLDHAVILGQMRLALRVLGLPARFRCCRRRLLRLLAPIAAARAARSPSPGWGASGGVARPPRHLPIYAACSRTPLRRSASYTPRINLADGGESAPGIVEWPPRC